MYVRTYACFNNKLLILMRIEPNADSSGLPVSLASAETPLGTSLFWNIFITGHHFAYISDHRLRRPCSVTFDVMLLKIKQSVRKQSIVKVSLS